MKDLTQGKPWKVILYFVVPILLGNLFNLAYNLADMRIVGQFVGNDALAAVGSVSTLSDLFIGFIIGVANGFAVITAQFFGRGQKDKARKLFAHTIELGLIITTAIVVLSLTFMPQLFKVLNIMDEHWDASMSYIRVITIGLFFTLLYNSMAATLRATGDAYTPLIFLIVSAIINIILDLIFVRGLGLGVSGAAVATLLAQAISAVACFIYTWTKYPFLRIKPEDLRFDEGLVTLMLKSGFSMGLMSCLVQFGTLALQTAINSLGTNTIVAHAATRKLTNIFMLPFGVLGTAMATYCGQNFGAGRLDRIKEGLKATLIFSYGWSVVCIIVSYTICPNLIRAISATTLDDVVATACLYQRVDTLLYFLVPTISILRNSLQGMGDHSTPIISSSMELVGKVLFAYVATPVIGYWGIIWAEPVSWSVMVIPLIFSMTNRLKKL